VVVLMWVLGAVVFVVDTVVVVVLVLVVGWVMALMVVVEDEVHVCLSLTCYVQSHVTAHNASTSNKHELQRFRVSTSQTTTM
jgi:hypothetical protein